MATRALQQVICYTAWNTSTNVYVTGDSANHSTSWCKDGTRSATTNATAEVDATNMPGLYKVTMTSTETDCIEGVLGGKSSTANVVLIPTMVAFDYLNTSAPTTAGIPDVNVKTWLGGTIPAVNVTGVPLVDLKYTLGTISPAAAGSVGIDWAQVANKTSTVALTNTTVGTVTTVTNQLTAAAIATGVWTDTTAGDFTVALSVGKSVMNGVTLGTGLTVNNLTNLPAIPNNWITAAGITAAALNGKGDWLLSSSYTSPPTTAQIATGVWTDTTAGDFTTALSVGKSVMNGVSLGTGLTVNAVATGVTVTTNNDKTGYSLTQAFPTNFSAMSITAGGRASITSNTQKNAAGRITFVMTDATTHAPKTGLTVTSTVAIDGAAFGATVNAPTEVGTGTYTLVLAAADTNGNDIVYRFTAAGADDLNLEYVTQP